MNNLVIITDQKAVTTSLILSNVFEKQHKNVLQSIEHLECSREFTERNFAPSGYKDSTGRNLPMYHITRDGFIFLAMGFTGPKAARFKEAFISEFNRMEQELRKVKAGPKADKRVDVNMNHTRGITNPHGLDIQYRLDLTKIAQNPTRAGLAVIERLTGICMEDVIEDQCEISSEGKQILEHYLACGALDGSDEKPVSFKHFFEQFVRYYEQTNPGRPRYMLSKKAVGRILREKGFDVRNKGGGTIINGCF
jgi:Rha family phage regulatory protein